MPPPARRLLPALVFVVFVLGSAAIVSTATAPVVSPPPKVADESMHPTPRPVSRIQTLGDRAATIALKAVGVPYRWGGASPASGFDCSGLVYWSYKQLGLELPHSSYALYEVGRRVAPSRIRRGDVLFFWGLGHVGIYMGRGRMIHAPRSGRSVEVVSLGGSSYGRGLVAARRLVGA